MQRFDGNRTYRGYRRPAPQARRRSWWFKWAIGGLSGVMALSLGWIAYGMLGNSEFFQVTGIDIEGTSRVSKEKILELSGVDIHSNLVALSARRVRLGIESHDWIESAKIERQWPNRLLIRVRERVPVAIVNRGGRLSYLDRKGTAFAQLVPPDDMDYPVISGVSKGLEENSATRAALTEALLFIRYAGGGNPNLPAQNISEINIANPDEMVLYLMSRPFPIRLGRGEMKGKYERLVRVLDGLYKRRKFTQVAYIDMDYTEGRILVGFNS